MATRATKLGWRGEEIARHFLERRGFVFVEGNFRTRYGEIDLVMRDGNVTVFVEVKTRQNRSFGAPEEAVDERKFGRMQAAAEAYLAGHPSVQGNARFDLVVLERSSRRDEWRIRHIQIM